MLRWQILALFQQKFGLKLRISSLELRFHLFIEHFRIKTRHTKCEWELHLYTTCFGNVLYFLVCLYWLDRKLHWSDKSRKDSLYADDFRWSIHDFEVELYFKERFEGEGEE